uniref:Uncharacterized protein n=1 Tax=Steinernema glaseri TaxID=37863 RepID=A0A1I8A4I4_9BILA
MNTPSRLSYLLRQVLFEDVHDKNEIISLFLSSFALVLLVVGCILFMCWMFADGRRTESIGASDSYAHLPLNATDSWRSL